VYIRVEGPRSSARTPRNVLEMSCLNCTYRLILERHDAHESLRAWSRGRDEGKSTLHHVVIHEMVFHFTELEPLPSNLGL
jgi:hypothetical protein